MEEGLGESRSLAHMPHCCVKLVSLHNQLCDAAQPFLTFFVQFRAKAPQPHTGSLPMEGGRSQQQNLASLLLCVVGGG